MCMAQAFEVVEGDASEAAPLGCGGLPSSEMDVEEAGGLQPGQGEMLYDWQKEGAGLRQLAQLLWFSGCCFAQ